MNRKPFVLQPEKYTTTQDLRNSELMRALIRHGAVIKRKPVQGSADAGRIDGWRMRGMMPADAAL